VGDGGRAVTVAAAARHEARWPVVVAISCAFGLLAILPDRIRLVPPWINALLATAIVATIVATAMSGARPAFARLESRVVYAAFVYAVIGNLVTLWHLIGEVVGRWDPVPGLALLSSSVALWCVNVVTFSLLYWQLDRGGPAGRDRGFLGFPDLSFPQSGADEGDVPAGWRPGYADYLFLSFCTATAFSPTDVLPFTTRTKMAMMLESSISLTSLALVAARAINILGS
jgi:hypothetical protein